VIEDPALTAETEPLFDGEEGRVSWDNPIHGVEDVEALPWEPDWLNIKPSRFGSVRSLLETIEYCRERGIQCYGGGQFELDVGRQHLHALASLFYPEAPNDVAPGVYNDPELGEDLPTSPLEAPSAPTGFEWH
jgi:O-succinylbenzoate synthase